MWHNHSLPSSAKFDVNSTSHHSKLIKLLKLHTALLKKAAKNITSAAETTLFITKDTQERHFSKHKLWNGVITGSRNKLIQYWHCYRHHYHQAFSTIERPSKKINRSCRRRPNTKERMCHQEHLLAALYKLACTAIVTRRPCKGRNNYFLRISQGHDKNDILYK